MQGPGLVPDGAGPATVGAGLGVAEGLGLLLQEGGQGALGQAPCGLQGHLLQGGKVHVVPRAVGSESAPGHDLAPPGRQLADGAEVFGVHSGTRHGYSCLVLGAIIADARLPPFYAQQPIAAKQVLTSKDSRPPGST